MRFLRRLEYFLFIRFTAYLQHSATGDYNIFIYFLPIILWLRQLILQGALSPTEGYTFCLDRFPPTCWYTPVKFWQMGQITLYVRNISIGGAGIAQWLEHRTRDWKVAGSNPCWNGGRIFFSRVDFLCWLLFRYPFHPRVTTVARKKSRSFCQKCRWQVTAKRAYTLRMWILLNRASALVTTCP